MSEAAKDCLNVRMCCVHEKGPFEDAIAELHVGQDSASFKSGWCAHLCGYQWTGALLGDVVPMYAST